MSNYFKQLPDFDYVSRLPDAKISDYITVKNLFKRGELATDIFQNLAFFTKYEIIGNDRPDNVAYDTYGDPEFDWVVLLSNNIINIQSEWPMTQNDFNRFLLDKYGTYDKINATHHYQTKEVKNQGGAVVVPAELEVESDYSVTYYDWYLSKEVTKLSSEIVEEVTNYDYEIKKENKKRDIFLLKPAYLPVVQDDLQEMMTYKEGSTQYLDETLKVAENIRLYQ
tara:strand:- start:27 stop:698 length:672 start_codon:yes stop_codon:yes gene_type:complete